MELAKIVVMRAHPDRPAALGEALRLLVDLSRNEAGCTVNVLHNAEGDVGLFMVYERWQDEAAFAAHMDTPHVAAFLAQVEDLLAEPPDVRSFETI